MSLIQRITSRRFEDIINQGFRATFTGTQSGSGTDVILVPGSAISTGAVRIFAVTGYILSTNNGSSISVSLGFKNGSSTTVPFASGYILQGAPLQYTFPMGDERYSSNAQGQSVGDSIVITCSGGPVIYTIYSRVLGEQIPLGYIEYPGAPAHHSPVFPPEGGIDRKGGDSV